MNYLAKKNMMIVPLLINTLDLHLLHMFILYLFKTTNSY